MQTRRLFVFSLAGLAGAAAAPAVAQYAPPPPPYGRPPPPGAYPPVPPPRYEPDHPHPQAPATSGGLATGSGTVGLTCGSAVRMWFASPDGVITSPATGDGTRAFSATSGVPPIGSDQAPIQLHLTLKPFRASGSN